MKKIILIVFQMLFYISIISAETNLYTLKAVTFHETVYAEWGIFNDKEYEDRYDGMEFEIYENGILIGTITVFQHWFTKNRINYPKIGESIKVEAFNFKVRKLPVDNYSIEYSALTIRVL
jgi:hypothetical protein